MLPSLQKILSCPTALTKGICCISLTSSSLNYLFENFISPTIKIMVDESVYLVLFEAIWWDRWRSRTDSRRANPWLIPNRNWFVIPYSQFYSLFNQYPWSMNTMPNETRITVDMGIHKITICKIFSSKNL